MIKSIDFITNFSKGLTLHPLDNLPKIDVLTCTDNLNGVASLKKLTVFLINSNEISKLDVSSLADRYLHKEELETYQKRLNPLAQKEFIASRMLIKRIVTKVYNYPFDHLKVTFNQKQLCLQVFFNKTLLPLSLSLSHSKGLVTLAIIETMLISQKMTVQNPLLSVDTHCFGIDIENICEKRDWLKLAKYYFNANDIAYLLQPNQQQKAQKFYQLWTIKEAYCKMIKEPIVNNLSLDTAIVLTKYYVATCQYNQHKITIVIANGCQQPNTILLVDPLTLINMTTEHL